MIDLKSALLVCAEEWARRHGDESGPAPLSRLGKQVAGDAKFFGRVADRDGGMNLATLEKFAAYLLDPANWPEPVGGGGRVPQEARDLAHRCGISLNAARQATGNNAELSSGQAGQNRDDRARTSDEERDAA